MKVRYKGYDSGGTLREGAIEAASLADASEQLRVQGVYATEVAQDAGGERSSSRGGGVRGKGKSVSGLMRQLSVLVASGTQIADAIAATERELPDGPFKAVVTDVRERVEQGESLSEAFGRHPKVFDAVCQSLVEAGESSGQLEPMLARLADITRQQEHVRGAVRGALVYPVLLVSVSVSVLIGMVLFVIPRFAGMFESLDAPLPATTQALLWLSGVLWSYWWAILLVIIAIAAGAWTWGRSDAGRASIDKVAVSLPVVGPMLRSFATARLARLLGVLLESRVPLLEALELTQRSFVSLGYQRVLQSATDAATKGESISSAFGQSGLVVPSVVEAMRNGERSGEMGPVLTRVAGFLDEDNEVSVRTLTSVIEPVILLALGIVVAGVAISMFLPMFDLVATAPGGA